MKYIVITIAFVLVAIYGLGFQLYYSPKWEDGACMRTDVMILIDDVYVPMGDDVVSEYRKNNSSFMALIYYPIIKWYAGKYMVLMVE